MNIVLTPGNLGANYCWPGPQQFYEDIIAATIATLPGTFNGINFGPNTPAVDDQDKPWLKTDAAGKPIGWFVFLGAWIWPHPVGYSSPVRYGPVEATETAIWSLDGGDGEDPANPGNPYTATDTTGAFWIVDHNYDFRVPVGAGTAPVDYGSGKTVLAVADTGGEEKHTMAIDEIAHTHTSTDIQTGAGAHLTGYDPAAATNTGSAIEGVIQPHNNMQPYRAAFFIKRTARKYYVG